MKTTFCKSKFSNLVAILVALAGATLLGLDPSLAGAAPVISVSGGITPGYAGHAFPVPQLLFTWTKPIDVTGSGFSAGKGVSIVLRGPLNSPGVTPTDRTIGMLIADAGGSIAGPVTIPYDNGVVGAGVNIPRPGRYEVRGVGGFGTAVATNRINLCPATAQNVAEDTTPINWGTERGARDGLLGEFSPERVDPHYQSVWDERPVEAYGTVRPTPSDGGNEASLVRHSDWPGDHFAHDLNFFLSPDTNYQWLVGTANYYASSDTPGFRENGTMEIEWETQNDGSPGTTGHGSIGLPSFAWPTPGDRVYLVGRWMLDMGHPEKGVRDEIHPPRLLATMRKRDTVTPLSAELPDCMTRASQVDIFVSGHGGGANEFLNALSAALNNGGLGGGRIKDALSPSDKDVYDKHGPITAGAIAELGAICLIPGVDLILGVIIPIPCAALVIALTADAAPPAGPSGVGLGGRGPEQRPINDMNYDFDVPIPRPPAGASELRWDVVTNSLDSTAVNQVITPTDFVDGLPTMAHIHLPYLGADNNIYARTIRFKWDKWGPPGKHFQIRMDNIHVNDDSETDIPVPIPVPPAFCPDNDGEWFIWTDVCGQWIFLSDLNRDDFGDIQEDEDTSLADNHFDVYLDSDDNLRVFTQGYEQDHFDGLFGQAELDKAAYDVAIDVVNGILDLCNGGDNDDLGGAVLDAPSTPKEPLLGSWDIVSSSVDGTRYFNIRFTVTYIPRPPRIELNGVPTEFGRVCVGESEDRVIEIFNVGEQDLEVNTITVTGGGFSRLPSPNLPFTVAGGEHVDITVRFAPTAIDQGSGEIVIESNDPCQPKIRFALTGTPDYPVASLSGNLDFGFLPVDDRSVGSSRVLNFYINNAGGCRLRIDSVSIAAGSDPGFAIPPPPVFPQIIQPGESLAVPVLFNPPAPAGPRHATIEVSAANDPLHPMPLTISANGIGLSPTISATPGSTFFAPTVVSCSRTQAITIFNTGPAELIVDNASVAGAGYSLDPVVLPIRLAPNASTELNVRFAPPSIARRFDGTLTLASDDLATPSKLVSFCGEGAPIGIRVLVLQADGTPYSTVDQITLSSYGVRPNASTSVRDAPLTAISPPASCQTIRYHYETALPATETSDTRGSYYNVKAKVGNKAQSVSFTLGECEFKEIVLALRSRDDPMLLNASRDGTAFTFSLATEPSVTCTVETTDSLSAPNWQPLQTLLGDGTVMTVRDSITNASQKYYRVKVE